MKRIVEKEINVCDLCGSEQLVSKCLFCGVEHCWNCCKLEGVEYNDGVHSYSTTGYFCNTCNAKLLADPSKSSLHAAFIAIKKHRENVTDINTCLSKTGKQLEANLKKLLKEYRSGK